MLARFSQFVRSASAHIARIWPKSKAGSLLSFFGLAIVALGVLGIASPASAGFLTDVFNGILHAFSWIMFILARLFIGLTIFFLKFFIEVAKYNNFIDTSTVKVGWFLVRDVANMFFVVILLVISFGTILGIEQYEWKKTLVKLILAAVFINFSNMIAQLIIDAAHVFTITFVNAISATAGGNLIRMFNIDTVYQITGAEKFGEGADLKLETFAASVTVFMLAFIMMVTIGAYALVMVARMVVLWVLIILSPLAYIFQVLPQTQKYAQEWWSTFINHVIVAPVMVFFLWLSFATLNDKSHGIQVDKKATSEATQVIDDGIGTGVKKLSISEASSWENMANYIIAIAFLLVGLRKVRELGVEAGGLTASVTGFAKNVGTIATGYALGRAIVGKGVDMGKDQAKKQFMNFPVVGGRSWSRAGKVLNEARASVPLLKMIPILGRYNDEYQDKLDDRLEKTHKMRRESRDKDFSKTSDPMIEKQIQKLGNLAPKLVHWGVKKIGGQGAINKLGLGQFDKGLFGIDAWTARRNAAEQELKAGVDMRSPENRALREASNRRELLQRGRRKLIAVEDGVFDKWAKKNGLSTDAAATLGTTDADLDAEFEASLDDNKMWQKVAGDKGLSAMGRASQKKKFKQAFIRGKLRDHVVDEETGQTAYQQFRNDDDAKKQLDTGYKRLNKSRPGATTAEREERNAAQYILTHERLETARAEINKEEKEGTRAVIGTHTADKDQLFEKRAVAEELANVGDEIVKRIKNAKLAEEFKKAAEALKKAMKEGKEGIERIKLDNPFVEALLAKASSEDREADTNTIRAQLRSDIEGEYIDKKKGGLALPSTAISEHGKRQAGSYAKLGEAGRGFALASAAALFASLGKNGKEGVTLEQRMAGYGALFAANQDANVDDSLSSMGGMVNRLDLYKRLEGDDEALREHFSEDDLAVLQDDEERGKLEQLRRVALKYGMIKKVQDKKTGELSWIDKSDNDSSGKLQAFMITGGDEEYIDRSYKIGELARDEEISYKEAAIKYFNETNRAQLAADADGKTDIASYEQFMDKMDNYQDIFSDSAEELKMHGLNVGHLQLSVNHGLDESMGKVRLYMPWEQEKIIVGSQVKRKGLKENPQSEGEYNNATGYQQRNDKYKVSNSHMSAASTQPEFDRVAMQRTIRSSILGNHKSAKGVVKDGYGMIGDSAAYIKSRGFGDDEEAYLMGLFDQLAQVNSAWLAKGGNAMALAMKSEFDNVDRIDAEAGLMSVDLEGAEDHGIDMKATTRSEFTEKVRDFLRANMEKEENDDGEMEAKIVTRFRNRAQQFRDSGDEEMAQQLERQAQWYVDNVNAELFGELDDAAKASRDREDAHLTRSKRTREDLGKTTEERSEAAAAATAAGTDDDGDDGAGDGADATPQTQVLQDILNTLQANAEDETPPINAASLAQGIAQNITSSIATQMSNIQLPEDSLEGISDTLNGFIDNLTEGLTNALSAADGGSEVGLDQQRVALEQMEIQLRNLANQLGGDDDTTAEGLQALASAILHMGDDTKRAMNSVDRSIRAQRNEAAHADASSAGGVTQEDADRYLAQHTANNSDEDFD